MEPNLLRENVPSSLKMLTNHKINSQSENQPCTKITVEQFLEFLKTAYQVQGSLEELFIMGDMTGSIDWRKLKESQFILSNEISNSTIENKYIDGVLKTIKSLQNNSDLNEKLDISAIKLPDLSEARFYKTSHSFLTESCELLNTKLSEVLFEGLLDPLLPIIPIMVAPLSRKPSISKISEKPVATLNAPSGEKNIKKKSTEDITKTPEKTASQVEIHVCDEVKSMKKDFYCNQKLLVEKMGYFAKVTDGQKLEDVDICVHCDVGIFEWLLKWVQKDSLLEEDWPMLDSQNVIPVMVSAAFLQMEPLFEECLRYCHENMNEILKTSTNLSCLNDQILHRLAALYTNAELDAIRDRKDKLQSKLFTKMIQSLVEPEPECLRGHWSSLARLYRCEKCQQLVVPSVSFRIPCSPSCMRLQYDGSIINNHVRDPKWNINEYIEKLFKQLKSWRKVYWRLWGNAHFLYCTTCKKFFPANKLGWCLYHSDAPQFFTVDAQKSPLPVGRHPCCGDRAYRFQLLNYFRGCKFKDHTVYTNNVKDAAVINLLLRYKHLIVEEPPELMFPEKLTRLVAKDNSTSDKLVCKEVFWWEGLQITPARPQMGFLNTFSEKQKGSIMDFGNSSSEDDSLEDNSNSNDSFLSGFSDESKQNSLCSINKKNKKNSCTLWQVHLSARSNQDTQRTCEEKTLKYMSALLNKRSNTTIESVSRPKCNRLITKNISLGGGLWVKLETNWKEQNFSNYPQKNRTPTAKLKSIRNGK